MTVRPELLRRAAAHAREAATAATEGPWKTHDTSLDNGGHTATVLTKRERVIDNTLVAWLPTFSHEPWNDNTNAWADSTHIALWHPGVALAVATWLEDVAGLHEPHSSTYGCDWCSDEDWPCADTRNALAMARTLLNEETPDA